jgi:hypothetical protein
MSSSPSPGSSRGGMSYVALPERFPCARCGRRRCGMPTAWVRRRARRARAPRRTHPTMSSSARACEGHCRTGSRRARWLVGRRGVCRDDSGSMAPRELNPSAWIMAWSESSDPPISRAFAEPTAAGQEDLEDLAEPVGDVTRFDECMYTVGVRSPGETPGNAGHRVQRGCWRRGQRRVS